RAASLVREQGIGFPILLGDADVIRSRMEELGVTADLQLVDPRRHPRLPDYVDEYFRLRQRRGITRREAAIHVLRAATFGAMMVCRGDADAFIAGLTQHYPEVIRPALETVGTRPGIRRVAG